MQVLFVRHGEAVDVDRVVVDRDRWLTESGRRTMAEVGATLTRLELRYDRIYTSPLVRAVQTAEILAATQPEFRSPLEVHPALSNERGTTAEALAPLDGAGEDELVVMVSHMPKIGVLAGHLGALTNPPSFRTGSACLVEVQGGRGRVRWMLDPDTLALQPR